MGAYSRKHAWCVLHVGRGCGEENCMLLASLRIKGCVHLCVGGGGWGGGGGR